MFHIRLRLCIFLLLKTTNAMFYYPSPQVSLLEHILVDNWAGWASNFSSAITPCTNYVTEVGEPALISGRTSAAQWIRVAFHDFVTGNVTAGTGGVDASIGFETFREENKGSAFNDSFTFWRPFVNEFVSMADLVAMGTVMSVNLCGGKYIPFRPGRVDAIQADPTTGVPEPSTSLEETLDEFERAGFNREDAIALTACGHTMGSVHHGGFPDVVDESAVTPNNTNGGSNFDTSRAAFDPRVVHEYIDGTGQLGGPLVSSFNDTSRSDLRLYESDGNATMQNLYDMGDCFQDVCVDLLGRMINTVPASSVLLDPITPFPVKPINITWDFDSNDNSNDKLMLSGKIRVLTHDVNETETIIIGINGKSIKADLEPDTGATIFGSTGAGESLVYGETRYYSFSVAAYDLTNTTSLTVVVEGAEDVVLPISSGPFIVPSLTTSNGRQVNYTIAVSHNVTSPATDLAIKVVAPIPQPLTLGPILLSGTAALATHSNVRDGYELWTGTYDVGQATTGSISLTLLKEGTAVDTLLLTGGVGGW
ncbi:heme peroxidase [Pestalotiopsis sp. NC0098]|nr:heme peroxidase [Pestalotiopsis sp. NC0098]